MRRTSGKTGAQIALADFYHRRLRPLDEIKALSVVANAPADASETLTAPAEQQSWQAFERIFSVIQDQGMPKDVSIAQYRAWLARYPQEQSLYARFLDFLVAQKDYAAARQLVRTITSNFPTTRSFPVKAKAMVEYRQGSVQQGLGSLRTELPAAVGSGTGQELFRPAAPDPESAQVSRSGARGADRQS